MTTKELINQYVTAHADNRWMDASELEALLTEFAEKLKEPASEDLEQAAIDYDSRRPALYGEDNEGDYVEYIEVRKDAFIAGAEWQREQIMKDDKFLIAIGDAYVDWIDGGINTNDEDPADYIRDHLFD